ncbi:MAG: hypothetical protein HY321_22625 [Armatimonadetes bacterium]|nr:hypothetical protein [Armatimonadota bacterium]
MKRRQFLRAGLGAGASLMGAGALRLPLHGAESGRKLVVVLFGGGARRSETTEDPEHRFIPRLWKEMVPRGTLFSNVRVERKVVHPNCAGSILTGHWEWDDLDWSRPVAHPTIFEVYRKERRAPDTAAWAFVYASILAKAGESRAPGYGAAFAANVVEPPTIPRATAEEMDRRMQAAAARGSPEAELAAAAECARLARGTSTIARDGLRSPEACAFLEREYAAWRAGAGTTSHDAFLTERALACMREFAPEVVAVAFGEIDCAHYGSWSRYTEAIRRTDELTWRLWRATEALPAYRGRTLLLILPDHGRELERPGSPGFIHHSDFYTDEGADEGCRRVWMLAIGQGAEAGRRVAAPVPITAAAATGLEFLGLRASPGAAPSVLVQAGSGNHT